MGILAKERLRTSDTTRQLRYDDDKNKRRKNDIFVIICRRIFENPLVFSADLIVRNLHGCADKKKKKYFFYFLSKFMWRKHGHTYIKIKNLQKDHTFDVVWCGAFQVDIDINIDIDIGSLHRHRQSA